VQRLRAPWDGRRPALEIGDGLPPRIARRGRLAVPPAGDLLEAGPLLVAPGARAFGPGDDADGFSADAELFDEDITEGRQPGPPSRSTTATSCWSPWTAAPRPTPG
jgi:hypothetical protein